MDTAVSATALHAIAVDRLARGETLRAVTRSRAAPAIVRFGLQIASVLRGGGTVAWMGNGGSAADSLHFAAELVGRMGRQRPAWRSVALSADPAVLSAVGNDFGFQWVFARQVEGLLQTGDLLVGLSTSGRSANVREGFVQARRQGVSTVALVGADDSGVRGAVDLVVSIPSTDTARVQELHAAIAHAACEIAEHVLMSGVEARDDDAWSDELTLDAIRVLRCGWRNLGVPVVAVHGVFEPLGVKEVDVLRDARSRGGVVVVLLSEADPIDVGECAAPDRVETADLLASLRMVDWVVPLAERDHDAVLEVLSPDEYLSLSPVSAATQPLG